jgi:hypothetical protein
MKRAKPTQKLPRLRILPQSSARLSKRSESPKTSAFSHLVYKGKARPPSLSLTRREKRIKQDLSTVLTFHSTIHLAVSQRIYVK